MSAGVFAVFFFSGVPKVRTDILEVSLFWGVVLDIADGGFLEIADYWGYV